MKVTIKTLQQDKFTIDAEPSETVLNLKEKIQKTKTHPVQLQKLIYSGKVLSDSATLESCSLKETDFVVLMVSKAAKPAASSSTPAPAPVVATPAPSTPAATTPAASAPLAAAPLASPSAPATSAAPVAPTPAAQPSTREFGDMSSFLSGAELQASIQNMMEMGFERDQVLRALKASFNNPDRAVDYLMNGIPAHLEAEPAAPAAAAAARAAPAPAAPLGAAPVPPAQPAAANPQNAPQNLFQLAQQQQQQQGAGGAPGLGGLGGMGGMGGGAGLNAAGSQMAQLRELVQQNPAVIQPLIQQLEESNPGIAAQLAANPGALMDILERVNARGGLEGDEMEGDGDYEDALANTVEVTQEEQAAIQRLEGLGFPRHRVLEAYLACDKNEEMAANYLFENGDD